GYVLAETEVYEENTRPYFEAHLCMMLAGRAGEEEFLRSVGANIGDVASNSDHQSATKLAYDMETAMGFAEDMPLLYRRRSDWAQHLATDPHLAARVNARLERAYRMARKLLSKQSAAVAYLREQLLTHRTLKGPTLRMVLEETRKLISP